MSENEDIKDFPHPLDTDIVEQVPVRKVTIDSVDETTGSAKFSVKTVMEQRTVRYIHAPKQKARCPDGEHVFTPINIKKYVFGCTKCPFARKVYPSSYMFKDGKLIHRHTRRVV